MLTEETANNALRKGGRGSVRAHPGSSADRAPDALRDRPGSLETYNVGQPGTITISGPGTVRLTGFPYGTCPYEAEVTSTANGTSRIGVGTARLGSPDSGTCYATLDASYFSLSGSGIQHNAGAAHADGYSYKRS